MKEKVMNKNGIKIVIRPDLTSKEIAAFAVLPCQNENPGDLHMLDSRFVSEKSFWGEKLNQKWGNQFGDPIERIFYRYVQKNFASWEEAEKYATDELAKLE